MALGIVRVSISVLILGLGLCICIVWILGEESIISN
jgi:hypothetical protein